MAKSEDLLQERLERLEAGEKLDTCLEGLSNEIADSLRAAAHLRDLSWPAHHLAGDHRDVLVDSLFESTNTQAVKPRKPSNRTSNIFQHWDIFRIPVVASAAVLAIFFAFVFLAGSIWSFVGPDSGTELIKLPFSSQRTQTEIQPDEAVLKDVRGLVEFLSTEQVWQLAGADMHLSAGTHLRTGTVSGAELVFSDGSQVSLGPNAELIIEEINVPGKGKARQIVFTQISGESQHEVVSNRRDGSHYEVQTPSGTGTAMGTVFNVLVRPDLSALFSVSEGEVAVNSQDVTVLVVSGQATTASPDEPPTDPVVFFTGSGEVTFSGETWVIDGQTLQTHPGTVVIGNPLVGDQVFFEGRELDDGTRLVDLIVLVRRSPANRFSLTGIVETIDDDNNLWTVNGQLIAVTDITEKDEGIAEGDLVHVDGLILPGGSLQAETIRLLEEKPGLPFEFTGVVGEIGDVTWVVSGIEINVTDTIIDEGLAVSDLVRVTGWILDDGTWLAGTIERVLDEIRYFEFIGEIESMDPDPWIVAEIEFETADWTDIDEGLAVGDRVRVIGQVMEDGTWVAAEIHLLEDEGETRFVFVGVVFSTDPWVVSGVNIPVDSETVIVGEIKQGMLVRVEILILPDGTWKVLEIAPVKGFEWAEGCQDLTAVVVSISGDQLQLQGWPAFTIDDDAEIEGEIRTNSVVTVTICFGEDGSVQVVYILILHQPEVEEPPSPELPGEKVMICHKPNGKNPHTIVVSKSAEPAHLGHGDTLGACP